MLIKLNLPGGQGVLHMVWHRKFCEVVDADECKEAAGYVGLVGVEVRLVPIILPVVDRRLVLSHGCNLVWCPLAVPEIISKFQQTLATAC